MPEKKQPTVEIELPHYQTTLVASEKSLHELCVANVELRKENDISFDLEKTIASTYSVSENSTLPPFYDFKSIERLIYDFEWMDTQNSLPSLAKDALDNRESFDPLLMNGYEIKGDTGTMENQTIFVVPLDSDLSWYAFKDSDMVHLAQSDDIHDGVNVDYVEGIDIFTVSDSSIASLNTLKALIASNAEGSSPEDVAGYPIVSSPFEKTVVVSTIDIEEDVDTVKPDDNILELDFSPFLGKGLLERVSLDVTKEENEEYSLFMYRSSGDGDYVSVDDIPNLSVEDLLSRLEKSPLSEREILDYLGESPYPIEDFQKMPDNSVSLEREKLMFQNGDLNLYAIKYRPISEILSLFKEFEAMENNDSSANIGFALTNDVSSIIKEDGAFAFSERLDFGGIYTSVDLPLPLLEKYELEMVYPSYEAVEEKIKNEREFQQEIAPKADETEIFDAVLSKETGGFHIPDEAKINFYQKLMDKYGIDDLNELPKAEEESVKKETKQSSKKTLKI